MGQYPTHTGSQLYLPLAGNCYGEIRVADGGATKTPMLE
jgi:hypothetical protein